MATPPEMKRGWIKKQARGGIVKNWQTRYMVLSGGLLQYFQEKTDLFPYGEDLKGDLSLDNATVARDLKKYNERQIYIVGANEKNLLLEAETVELALDWIRSIEQHINYATNLGGDVRSDKNQNLAAAAALRPKMAEIEERLSASAISPKEIPTNRSSGNLVSPESTDSTPATFRSEVTRVSLESKDGESPNVVMGNLITPKPGWVIKVLRTNGEKIFINLCEHNDVPQTPVGIGYNKWPFMIITPPRSILDEKPGGSGSGKKVAEVTVYDAVVNPGAIQLCGKQPPAKDAACLRALRLLKKNFGEDLENEYKLPKITKRYKGDVQQVKLPANLQNIGNKRGSISIVNLLNNNNSPNGVNPKDGKGGKPGLGRQASLLMNLRRASSTGSNVVNYTIDEEDGRESDTPGGLQRANTAPLHDEGAPTAAQKLFKTVDEPGVIAKTPKPSDEPIISPQTLKGNSVPFSNNKASTDSSSPYAALAEGNRGPIFGSPGSNRDSSGSVGNSPARTLSLNPRRSMRSGSFLQHSLSMDGGGRRPSVDLHELVQSRMQIPFNVIRSNGTIAKRAPDTKAQGKVLRQGVKVFVVARKIMRDGAAWLRTSEGWILEKVFQEGTQRILSPSAQGQPRKLKIATTRLEDATEHNERITVAYQSGAREESMSGWNWFSGQPKETFRTRFMIDVFYQDNAVIKLSRTLKEIASLRETMLNFPDKSVKEKTKKAGDFPLHADGSEELFDPQELCFVVETVENWLNKLVSTVIVDKCRCKALQEFFVPNDYDNRLMDIELLATGGIGGKWGEDELTQ